MKRLFCMLFVASLFWGLLPAYTHALKHPSTVETVWENPWTLTTYYPDGRVNSTFFLFQR